MQEESLEQKQKYLSNEILEADYDPEQFQDFMLSNSDKELDLNQWSIDELKQIVAKYKKIRNAEQYQQIPPKEQKKQGGIQMKQLHNHQQHQQDEHHKNIEIDDNASMVPSVNTSKYRNFQFRKKVNLPEIYILMFHQKKDFNVTLTSYSKTIPNNIFKSTYILYQIKTSQGWSVKRRFTDFMWLHKNLKNAYPGLPVPPIPQKTAMRSFEEHHLKERMKIFSKFLNTLTNIPQICSDPILEIFLRADDEYFSDAKKKFVRQANENYQTCTAYSIWGQDLVLAEHGAIQNNKINNFSRIKQVYEETNRGLHILKQNLLKSAASSFSVASCFQKAQQLTKQFTDYQILGVLQDFCIQIGQHISKTVDFIGKSLSDSWKYESMYISNLTKYMTEIKRQQVLMNQKFKNTMIKISEQSVDQMTNNVELSKPIKQYQIAKQQYKIKLSQTIRQVIRCEKYSLVKMTKSWAKDIKTFIGQVNQLAISQVDQLTRTMSIGEGKNLMEVQYIKT